MKGGTNCTPGTRSAPRVIYEKSCIEDVPVFYPTMEDMNNPFEKYIEKVEDRIAAAGIAKIVPPPGWTPRAQGYENLGDIIVPNPIKQRVTGSRGVYQAFNIETHSMPLSKFKDVACAPEHQPHKRNLDGCLETLERAFWKNVTHIPPLYGADGMGTLFDKSVKHWNVGKLDTLLSRTLEENELAIPGVTTPYLYFGMWRSFFAWHTEDVDLYSVNYLHFGESKSWYTIPPAYKKKFEEVLKNLAPNFYKTCPVFLRHKETLVSPHVLQANSIPFNRIVQEPGEFIINFPGVYHSGFNHGFNCAESTNFATQRWVRVGVLARPCACSKESVRIDMTLFEHGKERLAQSAMERHSLAPRTPTRAVHERRRRMQIKQSLVRGGRGVRAQSEEWEEWAVCQECRKWRVLPGEHRARLNPEADFCCNDIAGMSCRRSQLPYEEEVDAIPSRPATTAAMQTRQQTSVSDLDPVSPRLVGVKRKQCQLAAGEWKAQVVPSHQGCRVIISKSGSRREEFAAKKPKMKTKEGAMWPVGEGLGVKHGMRKVFVAAAERVESMGEGTCHQSREFEVFRDGGEAGHAAGNVAGSVPVKRAAVAGPDPAEEGGTQPNERVSPAGAAVGRVTRSHMRCVLPPKEPVRDTGKRRRVNRDLVPGCMAVPIKCWNGVTDGEMFLGGREFRRRRRSRQEVNTRAGGGSGGRAKKVGLVEEVLGRDGRIDWFPIPVRVPCMKREKRQEGGHTTIGSTEAGIGVAEVCGNVVCEEESGIEVELEGELEEEGEGVRKGDVVENEGRRMTRRQAEEELAITLMEQVKELEGRRNRVRSMLGSQV